LKTNDIKISKINKISKIIPKIILWIVLSVIFIRGIATFIRGNNVNLNPIEEKIETISENQIIKNEAESFAENFVAEYFDYTEYSTSVDNYQNNLMEYSNLDFSDTKLNSDLIYINNVKSEWINKDSLNITLKVKVMQMYSLNNIEEEENIEKKKAETTDEEQNTEDMSSLDTFYIEVPVSISDKNYSITNYPTYVAYENKTDFETNELPGKDVDEDINRDISELVTSFINGYYGGQDTELSYFMENGKDVKTIDDENYEIDIREIYVTEEDDIYYVQALYLIDYRNNKFSSGMEFTIIEKNKKYLIKKYD
jgi:hypothetical protein